MTTKTLFTVGAGLLWVLAVVAAVFAEALWFAHPPVARGEATSIERHLARELGEAAEARRLGSAALVLVRGGEIVAEHGFGVAHAETRAPVAVDRTLYRVASVSKAVTAWGVMRLVEEGRLSLDEPVMPRLKRWRFPGSEGHRDKVTVRHLLSHTAGLDDGLGYGGFLPGERVQSLEESLTLPRDSTVGEPRPVRVVREPGASMAYGSAGYAVLQLLVEEVTGRPFADYMREAVLRPLGMTESSFDADAVAAQSLATSYDHELKPQPHRRFASPAAVALHATPRDLALFVTAHAAGGNPVLTPGALRQMWTPQPGTGGTWGLGETLFAGNGAGGHVVGHDGGSPPAWGAMVRFNPATGNGMVLLVSGGRGAVNQLGHDWVYWETGVVTYEARRQVVYGRAAQASAAIIAGLAALVLWRLTNLLRSRRAADGGGAPRGR